jgi:predicted transcriptional regulator
MSSDGTLTQSARDLVSLLVDPMSPPDIARRLGIPLYRVRSSLREMIDAGLVAETDDGYVATDTASTEK